MELPGDLLNELSVKTQEIMNLGAVIFERGFNEGKAQGGGGVDVAEAVRLAKIEAKQMERAKFQEWFNANVVPDGQSFSELMNAPLE